MSEPQESPVPTAGSRPRISDLGWLATYALRGLAELAQARIAFARLKARDVPARNRTSQQQATPGAIAQPAHIERIAYVLPRLSKRLPWRSDCMVQALAAQNWLAGQGFASEIQIGVERPDDAPFGAHAWLVHGGRIVTGGDISRYARIIGDTPLDS